MDPRQQDEFNQRAHALSMELLAQSERQFEDTLRTVNRPWWESVATGTAITIALMGFGVVVGQLYK